MGRSVLGKKKRFGFCAPSLLDPVPCLFSASSLFLASEAGPAPGAIGKAQVKTPGAELLD